MLHLSGSNLVGAHGPRRLRSTPQAHRRVAVETGCQKYDIGKARESRQRWFNGDETLPINVIPPNTFGVSQRREATSSWRNLEL
ncbi:hypothetical protein HYQ46_010502 [Verticillium longisporum]|nr:hypothetical protein HYQ46_010502 [Verticillium longisporum]